MKVFSLEEWTRDYEPDLLNSSCNDTSCDVQTALVYDQTVIEDVDVIAKTDAQLVWSLTANPDTGKWSIVSGIQRENILGYLVTKKAHEGVVIEIPIDTDSRKIQTVRSVQ